MAGWPRLVLGGSAVLAALAGIVAVATPYGPGPAAEVARPAALIRQGDKIAIPPGSPYLERIVVAPVERKEASLTLILPAAVEADPARTINILPPVTGKVVELLVQLGDRVTQGQPLAVIDSGDLGQAYADHDKAVESFRLTKLVLERSQALADAGGAPIKDLQQAESDYAQAQAELKRAQARLKEIGAGSEVKGRRVLVIRAPVSGSVTTLSIAPGAYANDPTATMMTISNLDEVWVTANAPESNVSFLIQGMAVDVTLPAYPGQLLHGKVTSVSAVLEPDTRRTKVRISFSNLDGKLKPNMFANATFIAPPVSGLSVPTSALLLNNDSTSVFVEVEPHVFERRVIDPGEENGGVAQVLQGLTAGERIIVKGGVLLND